jgi:hypothetical protein
VSVNKVSSPRPADLAVKMSLNFLKEGSYGDFSSELAKFGFCLPGVSIDAVDPSPVHMNDINFGGFPASLPAGSPTPTSSPGMSQLMIGDIPCYVFKSDVNQGINHTGIFHELLLCVITVGRTIGISASVMTLTSRP